MKRAVICVDNPQDYINQLDNYSIMIVNPNSPPARLQYLLDKADYSLLITRNGWEDRMGGDYPGERLLWYTSGTTGDSKFCSFTQAQLDHLAETIVRDYNITANDRYASVMPLSHAHGQGFYWATRLAGCEQKFLSIKDLRQLPSYAPTFITAVPDVLKVVNQLDFDSLRFIRSASAPLPDVLYRSLQDHYRLPVIEAFGMTEALSHCFTNPLYGVQRMGTIGLPSGIEADIVDGQLYIRGPSVFVNDWYNTGDLAERDEDGYYRILGRHKDQINIKGKKLNPVSLELQLRQDVEDLGECVVFGSSRVKCLYTGTTDAATIKQTLLSYGPHCRPYLVEQVSEIPVSPSGKISRTWLDAHF
jgi:acyl-coenzyme A synthetase/AMP-(fatty) acid ligase